MSKKTEDHWDDAEYWAKKDEEFAKLYPDAPEAKPIECLNLIMKREFAEQILRGEKKVELRAFSEHYYNRLYDKDVLAWLDEHADDPQFKGFEPCVSALRIVEKIHFHNYNNSWFLDVECPLNAYRFAVKRDAEYLNTEYGCDELLQLTKDFDKRKEQNRPMFFTFLLGKVLDTNLK